MYLHAWNVEVNDLFTEQNTTEFESESRAIYIVFKLPDRRHLSAQGPSSKKNYSRFSCTGRILKINFIIFFIFISVREFFDETISVYLPCRNIQQ